jgi:hypothetical protein
LPLLQLKIFSLELKVHSRFFVEIVRVEPVGGLNLLVYQLFLEDYRLVL